MTHKKLTLADLTPVQRETYKIMTIHANKEVAENTIFTTNSVARFFKIGERAARKRLATLIDLGLVKRNGRSKKFATYSIKRVLT